MLETKKEFLKKRKNGLYEYEYVTTHSPGVPRKPTTPQNAAGIRREPPRSDPVANHACVPAKAAADPPDDPPAAVLCWWRKEAMGMGRGREREREKREQQRREKQEKRKGREGRRHKIEE